MASTIKVNFWMKIPCSKNFKIEDEKLWKESKNDFISAVNDEDGLQLIVSDYIEEYGLSPIENSYEEDIPNSEVESIQSVIDENGKSI
jgi:hypothetical protein